MRASIVYVRTVGVALAMATAASAACGSSATGPDAGDSGLPMKSRSDTGARSASDSGSGTGTGAGSSVGTGSAMSSRSATSSGSSVETGSSEGPDSGASHGHCVGSGSGHGHCDQSDGGTVGTIVCPGHSGTLVVAVPWAANALVYTDQSLPGFASTGALVLEFTTPAVPSPPPSSGFGSIQTIQDPGAIAFRNGSLSATPCDFTVGITGQPGISTVFADQDGPYVPFTLGYAKVSASGEQHYVQLQPNTTYYLNMYNPDGCGSAESTCDVRVQFSKPPGT